MGTIVVDQIGPGGGLLQDVDTTLSPRQRDELLLAALPGAAVTQYAGESVIRFKDQVIMRKQVTYLGLPWERFKKRIQIPFSWKHVYWRAREEGLTPRFVGVYHYGAVTIFVDFQPDTYVLRKANNSAAHVATNDLYQAQTLGLFTRADGNGNVRTSVRFELLAKYLLDGIHDENSYVDVFDDFNREFLSGERLEALHAVTQMHTAGWPDTMQPEWAGFYLEYRVQEFLLRTRAEAVITFQRAKRRGDFDYDLVFWDRDRIEHYGDLKASNIAEGGSPGNDAADIRRCVDQYGRFWYVIYEHQTWHSRDEQDLPVIEWNRWRHSVGHVGRKPYSDLSYSTKFKSAVRFTQMKILEVNEANFDVVLEDFNQGRQPDGGARAVKVMISKAKIDNFLIYSDSLG